MKKNILAILFVVTTLTTFAQTYSEKYGKITDVELKMTVYANDTAASAVVLYDYGSVYYTFTSGFKVITEVKRKIKILKQDGVNQANISIPYFFGSNSFKDDIDKLEGTTYNLENGKIEKSKIEKKYIFTEKLSKNIHQIKFTFPNVKVGSVIEYKYEVTSDRYASLPDKIFQENTPIRSIRYETVIPEYFIYNIEQRGYEKIDVSQSTEGVTFMITYQNKGVPVNCNAKKTVYTMKNVPALKREPFVWNLKDFTNSLKFELNGTNFPYDYYRPITNKWEDVEKTIREKTDFTQNLKKSVPFDTEVRTAIQDATTDKEKIEKIFTLVKSKVKWNDSYSFMDNDPREAIKTGSGNNAQINAILIELLNRNGMKAYPILMRNRSAGRLGYAHPSIDLLTTYVVGVDTPEGKTYTLDGSANYGGVDMMSSDLQVDRAYVLDNTKSEKIIDLTNRIKSQDATIVTATLNAQGTLTAEASRYYTGINAYYFKKQFAETKDTATLVEKMETDLGMQIQNFKLTGMEMVSNKVTNAFEFTKKYNMSGEYIYINPVIFTHITANPFTESERKLPIEFNYPYSFFYNATITLPDGYEISEMPKSLKMTLLEDKGRCTYHIAKTDRNTIQVSYRFDLFQIVFSASDYNAIRDFWGQAAIKNTEMIVLKKT